MKISPQRQKYNEALLQEAEDRNLPVIMILDEQCDIAVFSGEQDSPMYFMASICVFDDERKLEYTKYRTVQELVKTSTEDRVIEMGLEKFEDELGYKPAYIFKRYNGETLPC